MPAGQASTGRRRIRAVVNGRVQGVAYRASTQHEATRLGVVGWVANQPDGSVVLEAEGPIAAVDALVAWCHHGPRFASVTAVTVDDLPATDAETAFMIRH